MRLVVARTGGFGNRAAGQDAGSMGWSVDPVQLVPIVLAALLYAGRVRSLHRRGRPVAAGRVAAFIAGLALLVLALVSPIDTIGESRLFSVHMLQHLLIGDLAPLLIVLGLTGAVLRPVLVVPAVQRLRVLVNPVVVVALWAADLALWHLPVAYDAALDDDVVHAAEHLCFFTAGLFLWTVLLGTLPGPRWFGAGARLASLGAVWAVGTILANVFLWSGRPYYTPYTEAPRTWGLSPLADQRAGGGVMLVEMTLVVVTVAIVMGLRWLEAAETRQRRLERRSGSFG
jgi:putative membrane protein